MLSAGKIIRRESPTLRQIREYKDDAQLLMIISMAINEICDFVNVGVKMSPSQVAMTAKLVASRFWYFKMEDIKSCFYSRLTTEKVYTLDGQTIMRWLGEYDLERDNACEDAAVADKGEAEAQGGVSYNDWLAALKAEAASGNKNAAESLAMHNRLLEDLRNSPTEEQLRKKEIEFRIFKHNYLKSKGLIKTDQ